VILAVILCCGLAFCHQYCAVGLAEHRDACCDAVLLQSDTVTAAKLKCAAGLAALASRKYKQAAKSFVNVSPDLASSYSEVRTRHLALVEWYATMCVCRLQQPIGRLFAPWLIDALGGLAAWVGAYVLRVLCIGVACGLTGQSSGLARRAFAMRKGVRLHGSVRPCMLDLVVVSKA
jgi:hypothetical protein